jgi:hypothetical protein
MNPVNKVIFGFGCLLSLASFASWAYQITGRPLLQGSWLPPERVLFMGALVGIATGLVAIGTDTLEVKSNKCKKSLNFYPDNELWYGQFEQRRRAEGSARTNDRSLLLVGTKGAPVSDGAEGWLETARANRHQLARLRRWVFYTTLEALAHGYKIGDRVVEPRPKCRSMRRWQKREPLCSHRSRRRPRALLRDSTC